MSLDTNEGSCLWAAIELAAKHNIYDARRLVEPPWVVIVHPPVYYALGAPFQFFGSYSYAALRAISVLAFVGCMFYFFRLLRVWKATPLSAAIGLLTLASYVFVWAWSFKARVDMLGLCFTVMSLYYFAVADQRDRVTGLGLFKNALESTVKSLPSIFCLTAAVFTKQSSIVILPAVMVYLIWKKRYVDLLIYAIGSSILLLSVFLAFSGVSGGGFLQHMMFGSRMEFSSEDLQKHLFWLGVDWPKLWAVPLLGLIFVARGKDRDRVVLPLSVAIISGGFTGYLLGGTYANWNNGFILYLALSWLTVLFLESFALSLGVAMIILSGLSGYIISTQIPQMSVISTRMERTKSDFKPLNLKGKTIFVEDPALAIECGATPLFVDVAALMQTWRADKHSLDDVRKAVEERRYPAIVINQNDSLHDQPSYFWSESLLEAIERNYQKIEYVAGNGELQQLYLPKSSLK
ncbi:MAG: hypothetical protein K2X93_12895 [Candidatus Obscuribacterales bacterium]|nr:hypothetical protein [Candidatus Obscuribacterales bacterium]